MSGPSEGFNERAVQDFNTLRNSADWQIRDDVYIPALKDAVLVMLVKNAEDVIGINLSHHFALGFRYFFIMDNNSNDLTADIIKQFKNNNVEANVFYCTDFLVGHFQKTKTEAMARFAESYLREIITPSWIFPVDVDELITCCTKDTQQAIEGFSNYLTDTESRILVFNWAQSALFSKERDEITLFKEKLGVTEFQVWKKMAPCVTKAAYKVGCNLSPTMGNHFVDGYEGGDEHLRSMIAIGFCMLHFPLRSVEQLRKKLTDGVNGLKHTQYPASTGEHWRVYFSEYEQYGDKALERRLREHIMGCSR